MDATRAIRALPGWQATPIQTLTANGFEADRQQCHDAGTNDVITKPVLPNDLYLKPLKWLPPAATQRPDPRPAPPEQPAPPAKTTWHATDLSTRVTLTRLADLPGLDVPHGLAMLHGKAEKYIDLLGRMVTWHIDAMGLGLRLRLRGLARHGGAASLDWPEMQAVESALLALAAALPQPPSFPPTVVNAAP